MALLDSGNAIFYHPLGNVNESTQNQDWGTGGSTTGKIATATSGTSTGVFSFGSFSQFGDATSTSGGQEVSVAAISSTQAVLIWDDRTTNEAKSRVATISGTNITFGPVVLFAAVRFGQQLGIFNLSSTKVIAGSQRSGIVGSAFRVGTVSGSNITWGTEAIVNGIAGKSTRVGHRGMAVLSSTKVFVNMNVFDTIWKPIGIILTISGSDITAGAGVNVNPSGVDINLFPTMTVVLDSTHAVVFYKHIGANPEDRTLRSRVVTISGTSFTIGAEHSFAASSAFNVNAIMSVVDLSSTKFAVLNWMGNGDGEARIGTVSGTDITYGAANVFTTVDGQQPHGAKLTSTTFIVSWSENGTDPDGHSAVFTVSGTDITVGTAVTYDGSHTSASSTGPPSMIAALSSTTAVVVYRGAISGAQDGFNEYRTNAAQVGFGATLTAPTPASYPSTIADTRVVVSFWANNPTSGDSTVTIKRGYEIVMSSSTITLGGTTATWNVSLSVNDSTPHFIVLDFENTGGTNWTLKTSVDGAAFTDQGTQDSGTQAVTTTDTAPELVLSGTADQWVDELVMWTGNTQFTSTELDNLHDLANDFSDPMDEYTQRFLTITLQSDPSALSITATTDREGNGNGTAPFSREYAAEDSVSFTAPASSGGRVFLEWRNSSGDVVSASRSLTKTLALSETETFKAFYNFVGDSANNYVIVSN